MGDLAPGETVDQYQLLDVIARSGMATIFRARDLENGHPVALKVPHLQYASDLVFHERFRREEEIGQRLDHPAVIKVCATASAESAACPSRPPSRWPSPSPTRSPTCTTTASSTATSSPRTSWSARTAG